MAVEVLSVTNDDGSPATPIQIPEAGPPGPDGWAVPVQTITASTGTTELDYSLGKTVVLTLEADTTLSVKNWPPANELARLTLYVINTGNFSLTWPTGTKWSFPAPSNTQGAGVIDFFAFTTIDSGATVLGHIIGLNYA